MSDESLNRFICGNNTKLNGNQFKLGLPLEDTELVPD